MDVAVEGLSDGFTPATQSESRPFACGNGDGCSENFRSLLGFEGSAQPTRSGAEDEVRKRPAAGCCWAHTHPMNLDADLCYGALQARDTRFDGRFFVAVT